MYQLGGVYVSIGGVYVYQLGGVRVSFRGCMIIVDHNKFFTIITDYLVERNCDIWHKNIRSRLPNEIL